MVSLMAPLMVSLSNHPDSVLRQAQDERGGYIMLMAPFMMPLMVSLSNHPDSVLRQAQDERGGYIPLMAPFMAPLMVSLSNHPDSVLRQAQDERGGYIPLMVSLSNHPHYILRQAQDERGRARRGVPGQPSFAPQTTVIINNRRSGESRNPGNPPEKSGPATEGSGFWLSPERRFYGWYYHPRRGGFVTRPGSNPGVC